MLYICYVAISLVFLTTLNDSYDKFKAAEPVLDWYYRPHETNSGKTVLVEEVNSYEETKEFINSLNLSNSEHHLFKVNIFPGEDTTRLTYRLYKEQVNTDVKTAAIFGSQTQQIELYSTISN